MTLALVAAMAVALLDVSLLGLPSGDDSPSTVEWLLRAVFWVGPFGLLLVHSNGVIRSMTKPPVRWRTAMLLWAIATAPFVGRPAFSLFIGAMSLCAIGLPAWYATRVGWRRFVDVLAVTAGVLAAASVVSGAVGMPDAITDMASGTGRLKGVSTHPNQLAQVAGVAVLLAWHYWSQGRARVAMALTCVGGVALLWSQSRTGIAALALGLAWILFRQSSRATRARSFVIGLLVVVGVVLIGIDALAATVARSGSTTEVFTLTGRTEVWRVVVSAAFETPLTGRGFASMDISDAVDAGLIRWEAGSAHSDWLNALLIVGVPGMVMWLGMWLSFIRHDARDPDTLRQALMIYALSLGWTEVAMGPVFPTFLHYVLIGCLAATSVPTSQVPSPVGLSSRKRIGRRRRPSAAPYSSKT